MDRYLGTYVDESQITKTEIFDMLDYIDKADTCMMAFATKLEGSY